MIITKVSMLSNIKRSLELDVTVEEINAWRSGMLIQDAMPELDSDQREFLISGLTPDEYIELFKE